MPSALTRLLGLVLVVGAVAAVAADTAAPTAPAPAPKAETTKSTVATEAPADGQSAAGMMSTLILTQRGDLPIIISAPHGGTIKVSGVPPRKGEGLERGSSGYFTGRDGGTEELAQDIAAAVEKKFGKKPYLVVARFARSCIDANRPPEIAYEDPDAKPVYDEYHGYLAEYCKAVKAKFGRGLLIDVHGHGRAADTIIRGTNNGQSVKLLRERFGEPAVTGPKSLFGLLAAGGDKVYPADLTGKEFEGLTGGFITKHYGSSGGFGIDSTQLEFGTNYRTPANRKATADRVTAALAAYTELYLTDKD